MQAGRSATRRTTRFHPPESCRSPFGSARDPDAPGPTPDEANGPGRTYFAQRALFYPHGLAGQLYWWSVKPFHGVVFGGMQRNIARAAELAVARQEAGSASTH